MRLHTDKITLTDLRNAAQSIPGGAVVLEWSSHGSRSRAHAFEVSLEGYGGRHTRAKNWGTYGGARSLAATWDDWGFFIAYLYEIDPEAFWGSASYKVYPNAEAYHIITFDRFNIRREDFPTEPLPALKRAEFQALRSEAWRTYADYRPIATAVSA